MAAPNIGPSSSDDKSKHEAASKVFRHKMGKHPLARLHAKLNPKSQSYIRLDLDEASSVDMFTCYIDVIGPVSEWHNFTDLWSPVKNDLRRLLFELEDCYPRPGWGAEEESLPENER